MGKEKVMMRAKSICSEFNIPKIASHYGITRKIKWEEPLILPWESSAGWVNSKVYIYYFGTMVFVNFNDEEIEKFIGIIKSIPESIKSINKDMKYICNEDFSITVDPDAEEFLGYNTLNVREMEKHHMDMVALVLAKSVALDTIEIRMDVVFEQVEKMANSLRLGKLNIKEKEVASIIGRILTFKYTTISYIMLLDKPAVAWKNEKAENLFNELADLFELDDRLEKLNAKTQTLLDTTEIFANLSHARRATMMELVVIILILMEVVYAFKEPFMRFLGY